MYKRFKSEGKNLEVSRILVKDLTAEAIFLKGIISRKWLIVKQLKVNQQFERFNDKRKEDFISDSSYTKFTYVSDNNISGIKLIAIFNYQIKQKLIIFFFF